MRKSIIVALILCLLACGACAEGILPVLQTPLPEITETVSLHAVRNVKEVTPTLQKDGSYRYEYEKVTIDQYEDFGRAFAQEGFSLKSGETAEDGTVTAVVSKGSASVTVSYNAGTRVLAAVYSPRVEAMAKNPEEPYALAEDAVSVLPEIPTAVSLHAVTGLPVKERKRTEDGGWRYSYNNVIYDCYARLSVKLAEEGFSLVSAETLEDGTSRAVVTDGKATLTIDYNLETKDAAVTYSPGVFARDAARFANYTEIKAGEPFPLMEGVTATILGWEPVDVWNRTSYNTMWIPAKRGDTKYASGDGVQQIWISIRIDYNRPEAREIRYLLNDRESYFGKFNLNSTGTGLQSSGVPNGTYSIYPGSEKTLSGEAQGSFCMALTLTDKQMEHAEQVSVVFCSTDYLNRCIFRLTAENRKPAEAAQ